MNRADMQPILHLPCTSPTLQDSVLTHAQIHVNMHAQSRPEAMEERSAQHNTLPKPSLISGREGAVGTLSEGADDCSGENAAPRPG